MTALEAHYQHIRGDGRLAISRHRQSQGWVHEALRERFGTRGLAKLASLGLDVSLPAGAQPFEHLRRLNDTLEKAP